jgi:hypothetical protein
MKMPQRSTVSDLMLEQYHLGELAPEAEGSVREQLADSAELRARLAGLQESDRELAHAYPAEVIVPQIRERMFRQGVPDPRARRPVPRLAWAVPVAAMIIALATFSVANVLPAGGPLSLETRMKGLSPHLSVFRKTTTGAEELRSGTIARQGDVLQLSYAAAGARYGVIFSIDGRGTVTWHVPAGYAGGRRMASPLEERGTIVLPSAYELDDAPGFERFFMVYGSAPFDIAVVQGAIQAMTDRGTPADHESLPLPRTLGQFSLLVKK